MPVFLTYPYLDAAFHAKFLSWGATTYFLSQSSTRCYSALAGYPFDKIALIGKVSGGQSGYFVKARAWRFFQKGREQTRANLEKVKPDLPHWSPERDAVFCRRTSMAPLRLFLPGRVGF